jgi:hypothetical protein
MYQTKMNTVLLKMYQGTHGSKCRFTDTRMSGSKGGWMEDCGILRFEREMRPLKVSPSSESDDAIRERKQRRTST